jgi:hypothetical protein
MDANKILVQKRRLSVAENTERERLNVTTQPLSSVNPMKLDPVTKVLFEFGLKNGRLLSNDICTLYV